MKIALDTSVLVAALVRLHPAHDRAARWLKRDPERETIIATHAIAECWATLTAMPLEPRITSAQADAMLRRVLARVRVVALPKAVYLDAMERCTRHGLRSGAVYDALHLIAAEKAKATELLTLNVRDFTRLARTDGSLSIRSPD